MFIPAFWCGVAVTLFAELLALIVAAFMMKKK